MKIKAAVRFDTSRSTWRGMSTVVDFWPNRVVYLGSLSTDREQLAGDWRQVGQDLRTVITKVAGGRK